MQRTSPGPGEGSCEKGKGGLRSEYTRNKGMRGPGDEGQYYAGQQGGARPMREGVWPSPVAEEAALFSP